MNDLIVDGLAAYRIARLVTRDRITEKPRLLAWGWLVRRGHTLAADGIECPVCVSVWAAFVVRLLPRRVRYALAVAAVAALTADVAVRIQNQETNAA